MSLVFGKDKTLLFVLASRALQVMWQKVKLAGPGYETILTGLHEQHQESE